MSIHSEEMQPDTSGFVQGVDRIGTPGEMLRWGRDCCDEGRGGSRLSTSWRKSSFSHPAGNQCVEVKLSGTEGWIIVRNSNDPRGGVLAFTADEWTAFLAGARAGEFDL